MQRWWLITLPPICCVILAVVARGTVGAVAGLLLILFLPGWMALGLMEGSRSTMAVRMAKAVALSLVLSVLVSMAVQLLPWGLSRESVAVTLGALAVGGAVVGRRLGAPLEQGFWPALGSAALALALIVGTVALAPRGRTAPTALYVESMDRSAAAERALITVRGARAGDHLRLVGDRVVEVPLRGGDWSGWVRTSSPLRVELWREGRVVRMVSVGGGGR